MGASTCYDMMLDGSVPERTSNGARVSVRSLCYRFANRTEAAKMGSEEEANAASLEYQVLIGEPVEELSSNAWKETQFFSRFGMVESGHIPSLSFSLDSKRRLQTKDAAGQDARVKDTGEVAYRARALEGAVAFLMAEIVTPNGARVDEVSFDSLAWSDFKVSEDTVKGENTEAAKVVSIITTLNTKSALGADTEFKLIFEIGSSPVQKPDGALLKPTAMKISFEAIYPNLGENRLQLVMEAFGQAVFNGKKDQVGNFENSIRLDQLYFSWLDIASTGEGLDIPVALVESDVADRFRGTFYSGSDLWRESHQFFYRRLMFKFDAATDMIIWDPELGVQTGEEDPSSTTGVSASGTTWKMTASTGIGFGMSMLLALLCALPAL